MDRFMSTSGAATAQPAALYDLLPCAQRNDRTDPRRSSSPTPPTPPNAATRRCERTSWRARLRPRRRLGSATPRPASRRWCATSALATGPSSPAAAPAKQAAHDQVLRLRAAGHSVTQIEQALADTPTPLNRTGVWELLRGEGYQRLATRPTGQRGSPHRDHPPRTRRSTWPPQPLRLASDYAGVLLLIPGLVALDLPAEVSALHSALSLLALKAIGRRRVSHVDDVATDPPWPPSRGWSPSQRRPRLAPTPTGWPAATSRRCWPRWARRCCAPARPPGPTSTWTSTRSCTTATTSPWRPTTCPAAPSAPRAC